MKRRLLCLAALCCTGAVLYFFQWSRPAPEQLPGVQAPERQLLRIWLVSAPGGGESWLRTCLKEWEKAHPGVMTFLRTVGADELDREGAVPPDVLLYSPGDLSSPQNSFAVLTGISGIREELLRTGRWQGQQYGLPLCYAGYALAIDSALEPSPAHTPAPTTLLGRPAETPPQAAEAPGLPEGVSVLPPEGCGLFALGTILPHRPDLEAQPLPHRDVYQRFLARQCGAALLTTGQVTALGSGIPYRIVTGNEVITDQVFLASLMPGATPAAAQLLADLTSPPYQRRLTAQGLHTVRDDLRLYAAGTEGLIEAAAAQGLTCINAYVPRADVSAAAWQYWQGQCSLEQALLPLI